MSYFNEDQGGVESWEATKHREIRELREALAAETGLRLAMERAAIETNDAGRARVNDAKDRLREVIVRARREPWPKAGLLALVKQVGEILDAWSQVIGSRDQALKEAHAEVRRYRNGACEVCWNNAWVPTEEGPRCDYCWAREQADARAAELEAALTWATWLGSGTPARDITEERYRELIAEAAANHRARQAARKSVEAAERKRGGV